MNELVELFKNGDALAYDKIFEEYHEMVYKSAYLVTRSAEVASDITQETFIILYKKIGSWKGEGSAKSWLYRIAINCSLNYLRKEKNKKYSLINCVEFLKTRPDIIENQIISHEENKILRDALDKLPDKVCVVLILRYYNEFSQNEIAEILKIPVGTVKSRINRGLVKLRTYFENEQISYIMNEIEGEKYNG